MPGPKFNLWLHGLGSAAITGCASGLLTSLGISGASAAGVQIAQLSPKQVVATVIACGLVGAAAYLKQSPLPPEE